MLNTRFLSAVTAASTRSSARLLSGLAGAQRSFTLADGFLVAAGSDFPGEGLVELLVAQKRLTQAQGAGLLAQASRRAVPVETLLTAERLLPPAELTAALERVAVDCFQAAMLSPAQVAVAPGRAMQGSLRLHLGALVLDRFRALPEAEVRSYVGAAGGAIRLRVRPEALLPLRLQPAELVASRGAELPLAARPGGPLPTEANLRLGGALIALGLAGWHP